MIVNAVQHTNVKEAGHKIIGKRRILESDNLFLDIKCIEKNSNGPKNLRTLKEFK